jgi:hypothetical protein
MNEPRSYQQTLIIARIARAGGRVSQAVLFEMAGGYATNVLTALIQRGLIQAGAGEIWQLTPNGMSIAEQLFGASQLALFADAATSDPQ